MNELRENVQTSQSQHYTDQEESIALLSNKQESEEYIIRQYSTPSDVYFLLENFN